MKGNFHVRFLGEGAAAMPLPYPTIIRFITTTAGRIRWCGHGAGAGIGAVGAVEIGITAVTIGTATRVGALARRGRVAAAGAAAGSCMVVGSRMAVAWCIREGEHSGMWASETPPTFELNDITAFTSQTWCAATIAHDSFHSKLYHDYLKAHGGPVPYSVWEGMKAEQQCMKYQLDVMEHIGATKREMDWATKEADGNYIKEKETWQAYTNRNW